MQSFYIERSILLKFRLSIVLFENTLQYSPSEPTKAHITAKEFAIYRLCYWPLVVQEEILLVGMANIQKISDFWAISDGLFCLFCFIKAWTTFFNALKREKLRNGRGKALFNDKKQLI